MHHRQPIVLVSANDTGVAWVDAFSEQEDVVHPDVGEAGASETRFSFPHNVVAVWTPSVFWDIVHLITKFAGADDDEPNAVDAEFGSTHVFPLGAAIGASLINQLHLDTPTLHQYRE